MLRRGCEGLTSEQIDFRIDALGAEMAVDTSHSNVAIHAQVIARNLDPFVELLSRLLSAPTFPEEELERLKRESVAEIIEARDNDRVVAQKAMQRTLFEGHPYGQSSGGKTHTVQAITLDDVRAFYRRYLVRKNIVIGIAGDVTAAKAPDVAARLVAGLQRRRASARSGRRPHDAAGPAPARRRQAGADADADPHRDARDVTPRRRPHPARSSATPSSAGRSPRV